MMDYSKHPCDFCGEYTVIYHQYIADACCESCGKWEIEDREQIGKTRDDTYMRPGSNMWQADVILHGNASIEKYLRDNALA